MDLRVVEMLSKSLLTFEMLAVVVTVKSMSSRVVEVLSKSLLIDEVSATVIAHMIIPSKTVISLYFSHSAYLSFL